jgi:enoyl-[acyl-carrier-protein] reductase (NADH)
MAMSEEVAETVIWLAGDGASFFTGSSLLVDSGYIAQ